MVRSGVSQNRTRVLEGPRSGASPETLALAESRGGTDAMLKSSPKGRGITRQRSPQGPLVGTPLWAQYFGVALGDRRSPDRRAAAFGLPEPQTARKTGSGEIRCTRRSERPSPEGQIGAAQGGHDGKVAPGSVRDGPHPIASERIGAWCSGGSRLPAETRARWPAKQGGAWA